LAAIRSLTASQAMARCSRRESGVIRDSRFATPLARDPTLTTLAKQRTLPCWRGSVRHGAVGTASRTPPRAISERENASGPYGNGVHSVGLYGRA
jgi:hypothetical protein